MGQKIGTALAGQHSSVGAARHGTYWFGAGSQRLLKAAPRGPGWRTLGSHVLHSEKEAYWFPRRGAWSMPLLTLGLLC